MKMVEKEKGLRLVHRDFDHYSHSGNGTKPHVANINRCETTMIRYFNLRREEFHNQDANRRFLTVTFNSVSEIMCRCSIERTNVVI